MKILIVENDHFVTKMWSRWLYRSDMVKSAASVKEALNMLETEFPELIILDLRLNGPSPSGKDVYEQVRVFYLSKIPVIFITGLEPSEVLYQWAAAATEQDCLQGIKTKLLRKPISLKSLSEQIENARS